MTLDFLVFLAQQGGAGGSLIGMVPFFVIIGVMFFLMFRSQKKQANERKEMLASIKAGDKVITNGGIRGVVSKVADTCFVVKIADNVKIEVVHNGVATVEKKDDSAEENKGK